MDPFNIVIKRLGKQIALNIHPKDNSKYMVLCEGSLVGELFLDEKGEIGKAIPVSELSALDYPDYPCDSSIDCDGLLSDAVMLEKIQKEISRVLGISLI
jgi:hypothetical protein